MRWFKVYRRIWEDTFVKAKDELDAENEAICLDQDAWETNDCEYTVEEIDPVEWGLVSASEHYKKVNSELIELLKKTERHISYDDDLLKEIRSRTRSIVY